MPWYVVADHVDFDSNPGDLAVWTLSKDPKECGWDTDNGYPRYGLPKHVAQFLADAANEKEAREGVTVQPWSW